MTSAVRDFPASRPGGRPPTQLDPPMARPSQPLTPARPPTSGNSRLRIPAWVTWGAHRMTRYQGTGVFHALSHFPRRKEWQQDARRTAPVPAVSTYPGEPAAASLPLQGATRKESKNAFTMAGSSLGAETALSRYTRALTR
jgi:hypothetical protein